MASLTESFHISNTLIQKRNPEQNEWYDIVYLCVQKSSSESILIDGFKCYKFKSFIDADYYFNSNKKYTCEKHYRTTMIPVCKWIPFRFHKFYLNYKLINLFWKNDITLMTKKE